MQQIGVRTGGGQSGAERVLEHIARAAGVLADHDLGLMILSVKPAEIAADPESMIHGQVDVGLTAEPIGSKVFTHLYSSCFKAGKLPRCQGER